MKRRNPAMGFHPDLFADKAGKVPSPAHNVFGKPIMMLDAPPGTLPIHTPLAEVDRDELVNLPRAMFSNEEWEELDEDVRDEIEENDSDSQARVDELAKVFVRLWKWSNEGRRDFSYIEEQFEAWLENDHHGMWRKMPSAIMRQMPDYEPYGIDEDSFHGLINAAMVNTNNYVFNPDPRRAPDGAPIFREEIRGELYAEPSDYRDDLEACTPDEAERAVVMIDVQTDHTIDLSVAALMKAKHAIEREWDTGETFDVYADWDKIAEAVQESLNEIGRPVEEDRPGTPPPEERVTYRFSDGFYIQELANSDLPGEGEELHHCIWKPEQGYVKALQKGWIRVFSLRRPSGKPLITFAFDLDSDGNISEMQQAKGKANRKPGFDLGKAGIDYMKDMKKFEVEKTFEFLEKGLGMHIEDMEDHGTRDLAPAISVTQHLYSESDPWAVATVKKLGIDKRWGKPEHTAEEASEYHAAVAAREARGNPAPVCGVHGVACGGFCAPYKRRRR